MLLPVVAVNRRTGTEYVLVVETNTHLLRTYTREAFKNGSSGVLALPENIELFEPVATMEQASLWWKVWCIVHYGFVTIQFRGEKTLRNFTSLTLTDKGKKALGRK